MNQVMVKQLKNRYSDPNMDKRFVIGVDEMLGTIVAVFEKVCKQVFMELL